MRYRTKRALALMFGHTWLKRLEFNIGEVMNLVGMSVEYFTFDCDNAGVFSVKKKGKGDFVGWGVMTDDKGHSSSALILRNDGKVDNPRVENVVFVDHKASHEW